MYTAEGFKEDVEAETALVLDILKLLGMDRSVQFDNTDTELWANWMGTNSVTKSILRIGIPPKEIESFIEELTPSIMDHSEFIIDLANGQIFLKGMDEIANLRQQALSKEGYAVIPKPSSQPHLDIDPWGYTPDSLEIMRAIKSKWDIKGLFNPGAFLL